MFVFFVIDRKNSETRTVNVYCSIKIGDGKNNTVCNAKFNLRVFSVCAIETMLPKMDIR